MIAGNKSIKREIWWLLLLSSLTAHQMISANTNQNTMAVKPYLTTSVFHQRHQYINRNFTVKTTTEQSSNNVVNGGNSTTMDVIAKPIPLAIPSTNAIQLAKAKVAKRFLSTAAIKVNGMMRRVRKSLLPTTSASNKSVALNRTTALRTFNTKYHQQREEEAAKSHKQQLQQKPKVKERIVGVQVMEDEYQTNIQQSINDNVTAPNTITTKESLHQQDGNRNTSWPPMIVYPINSDTTSGYIEFDMNREEQQKHPAGFRRQQYNETRQTTIQEMLSNLFPKGFSDILRFSNMQEDEPSTTTQSPPAPVWIPPKIQQPIQAHTTNRSHQKYRRDLSKWLQKAFPSLNLPINGEAEKFPKLQRITRSLNEDSVLNISLGNDSLPILEDSSKQDSDSDLAESEINEIEYKPSESLHYQTFPNHNITIHIIHDNPNDENTHSDGDDDDDDDHHDEVDDVRSYFQAHFKSEPDSTHDENINSAPSTKLMTHQAFRENNSRKSQIFLTANAKNNAWRNRESFVKPPPPVAAIDAKRKYRNFQRTQNPRISTSTATSSANENLDYKTRYRTLNRNTEITTLNGRNSTPAYNVMFVTFNSASKTKSLNSSQIPTMTPMYPNLTPQEYVTEKKFGSKYNRNNRNKSKATENKTQTENLPNTYTSVEIQKSINIHNKLIREQDGKLLEEREEFPDESIIINPIKEAGNTTQNNSTQKRATQITYGLLSRHPILVEGDEHLDEESEAIEDDADVETSASTNNEEHIPAPPPAAAEKEQTQIEAIQQIQPIQEFHIIEYVPNNMQTVQNTPNIPNTEQIQQILSANYPINVQPVDDMSQQTNGQTKSTQFSDVNNISPPLAANFIQNSYAMPVLTAVPPQPPSQTQQQMEKMVGHPPVLPMLVALPYPVQNAPRQPNVPSSADNIINKSVPLDRPPPLFTPPSKKYKVIPHYPVINANPPPHWPSNFHPPNYLTSNAHLNPFNSIHKYFSKLFHKSPYIPPSNGQQVFPFYTKSKQIPVNYIKSGNPLKYEFLRSSPPASANVNQSPVFYDSNRDKINRYTNDYKSLPRDLITPIHTVIQNQQQNKRLLSAHKENGTIEGRNGQQLKRSPNFGRNLHVEYGFKPPLIPSVEINEEGIPLKSVGASLANDLM